MSTINVSIKRELISYNININPGIAPKAIKNHENAGGFFVVDKNIASIYEEIMPSDRVYLFNASEMNKNIEVVENILIWLKDNGALRDGRLMAIGGGITGDTAGFAASIYMRGIKFIQMPTTFLAMVDSSVGGKTGVNLGGIKNNIGVFHQPMEVVIDTDFIKTLSDDEFLNGFAESLKISCVYDSDFFYFLNANRKKILKRNSKILQAVIEQSCLLKSKIVQRDEGESGIRKFLNFGHTVAHAIETDSGYKIHHGHAVAMGMIYESLFALDNGYIDEKTFNLIKDSIDSFGYDTKYIPKDEKVFTKAILTDKKASQRGISLALTGSDLMGKIIRDINPDELAESIIKYTKEGR